MINKPAAQAAANAEGLLALIAELVAELHPDAQRRPAVALDSRLDKDLGIDSLGRAELLVRIERRFELQLSEQLLASAETPRDLLVGMAEAAGAPAAAEPRRVAAEVPAPAPAVAAPDAARTLLEVLEWHLADHPERVHIRLYGDGGEPEPLTYGELHRGATNLARGLRAAGLQPGQCAAIMLPTGCDYFFSFLGVLMAGGIPVPIYPPARPSQLEDHLRRHSAILANAQAAILITLDQARTVARLLELRVPSLQRICTPGELAADSNESLPPGPGGADIAFLQYTSGSTGAPKGVQLTHDNLLANLRAMGEAVRVSSRDVFVSWLPLYHDMGLIGAWMGSLYFAYPLVLMSPLAFLARPSRWLWAIHNHRGTLSAGPNFAYELSLRKVRDEDIQGLDLGSWRLAFNGAEPVSPQTLRRFGERFAAYGFRPEALAPVYGLAESSVGLAFPPPGRGPVIDRVRRSALELDGQAVPAAPDEAEVVEFAACGQPLRGHEVRVVDAAGRELPERRQGRLEFRGPSATSGYFRNPEASRKLRRGDWLDTGDLAYLAGGDIYLTSRVKDMIIRAGRNIYPQEVEEAVGAIEGVRKGCVAVFAAGDPESGTERLVVVAETRLLDRERLTRLHEQVSEATIDLTGTPPDEVMLAPPHTVLKTSSGKIRRSACRQLYEQGQLGHGERRVWLQLLRLGASGLGPGLRRLGGRLGAGLWAGYAWFWFLLLAPVAWIGVHLLPRPAWRWGLIHRLARLLLRLLRLPLSVEAEAPLAPGPMVLVANHASYLDGLLLVAALPEPLAFVAKAEFVGSFVAGRFLRRVGAEFVERFDPAQGLADVRQLQAHLAEGRRLVIFPEGTFGRAPGLLPFRMGAFSLAVEAGAAVQPLVIRGSRSLLRGDTWFPRREPIRIRLLAPIQPGGEGWSGALKLRDAARAAILAHCGEPDLGD